MTDIDTTPRPTPTRPETMRAATIDRYGTADDVRLGDRPVPTIQADEVLIEVAAAGVDRGVWHLLTGTPYLIRLMGYGFRRPKQPVLGLDVAGRVAAIGDDVTRVAVGDRVFGIGEGTFADYAVAKEEKLVLTPDNLSDEEAAASAVSGITAREAVVDVGRVEAGDRVLVIGASGGVGTFAVQIAAALGATVTGVGGPGSASTLREIGAHHTIDYTTDDFAAEGRRYDVIIDIAGRHGLRRLRSVLERRGTLVIVGGEGGNKLTGGIGRQLRALLISPFLRQRLTFFVSREHHENIELLAGFLRTGEVRPVIDRRFRLADAADAIRHMDTGRVLGKSVITVADQSGR